IVLGDGENIKKVSKAVGESITSQQKLFIKTDNASMPNMTGWSLRDLLVFKEFMQLDVELVGQGYIVKQSVEEDTALNEKDYIMVELEEPNNEVEEPEEEESS